VAILYVLNVVHTEPDWWSGRYAGLDLGVRRFLEEPSKLESRLECRIPITWCAG
jgi:hypothetical protein